MATTEKCHFRRTEQGLILFAPMWTIALGLWSSLALRTMVLNKGHWFRRGNLVSVSRSQDSDGFCVEGWTFHCVLWIFLFLLPYFLEMKCVHGSWIHDSKLLYIVVNIFISGGVLLSSSFYFFTSMVFSYVRTWFGKCGTCLLSGQLLKLVLLDIFFFFSDNG